MYPAEEAPWEPLASGPGGGSAPRPPVPPDPPGPQSDPPLPGACSPSPPPPPPSSGGTCGRCRAGGMLTSSWRLSWLATIQPQQTTPLQVVGLVAACLGAVSLVRGLHRRADRRRVRPPPESHTLWRHIWPPFATAKFCGDREDEYKQIVLNCSHEQMC
jgi:hypothetical protein